jgi:hypothetical protein
MRKLYAVRRSPGVYEVVNTKTGVVVRASTSFADAFSWWRDLNDAADRRREWLEWLDNILKRQDARR